MGCPRLTYEEENGEIFFQGLWKKSASDFFRVDYYPFGLSTANSWTRENTTGNNFLFNGGTELNTTTQVYDLHYRNYDPVLGRMNQVDPVASKYGSVTPYNYAFNAPTNMNDPLGDEPNGNCSWCNPKPRPIDTGSGGGGGGGGSPFAGLMGRSAGFFEPGWQPGSGSLSAGAFAAMDARYNAHQIQSGNVNGLREGTYTNNGNGGFSYSAFSGSFVPGIASLSQTDKNRIANAATYGRISYINGTLNITTIAISETGAGEETDYSYYLGWSPPDISNYTSDPLFWINGALGFAGVGVAYQGEFWKTNGLWHMQKNGTTRFRWNAKWNNNFVTQSRLGSLKATSALRTASNYLAGASLVLTGVNIARNGEVRASDILNATMAGISFTGLGSLVAGAYFLTDLGVTYFTGTSLGDRLDKWVGGPVVDLPW